MAIIDHVIAAGMSPFAASAVVGGAATALTATGTTLGTALLLSSTNNFFTTTATSTGAKLPACGPGSSVYVYNGGAQTLSVYGNASTEAIANGSVGAAFSVATNKGCHFIRASATLWGQNLSA